ncbi:MAG: DUF1349 domain-containing protein [Gemmatales bacterium]
MLAFYFLATFILVGQSEEKWEAVSTKDGMFTIQMPTTSEQEGSVPAMGPSGRIKQHELIRQSGDLQYWVIRLESSSEIPRSAEKQWLDHARDNTLKRFSRVGGDNKIATEKEVKAGELTGREFNIKTNEKNFGTTNIRGRSFVKGTTAYIFVAVSSVPNKELPAEADRYLNSITFTNKPVTPKSNSASRNTPTPGVARKMAGSPTDPVAKTAPKWLLIKSEKDGFTVELPGKPNGEGNESSGESTTHSLSYQNQSVEFIVFATHRPTPIPEAESGKALESFRTKYVGNYGKIIKVLSVRTVSAGKVEGQEFELSLDRSGAGVMRIQGRTFIQGKSAYVLFALPTKGKELPVDTQKFLESFTLTKVLEPIEKSTSSNTKPASNSNKTWGTEVNPDGDVKLKQLDSSLIMEIPGTAHVLAPERDKMNAPRVVSTVKGDFSVTVQVEGAFKPQPKTTMKGISARQAGGLVVWKDAKNYLVFQRRASLENGEVINQAVLEDHVGGNKGATHRQSAPDKSVFLRVECKRGRLKAAFSEDGKNWKELKAVDVPWAEGEIQVGVVGVNTSPDTHKITFTHFMLENR